MAKVQTGLENLMKSPPKWLKDRALGLLCNPASVDSHLRHSREAIDDRFPGQLRALYSPQHGFFAEKQDNMIESADRVDPVLNLPVYSLYGQTRIPTDEMLRDIEILLVDLLDVGTRVYTFIYTVSYCLERAAGNGRSRLPRRAQDGPGSRGAASSQEPVLSSGGPTSVHNGGRMGRGNLQNARKHKQIKVLSLAWNLHNDGRERCVSKEDRMRYGKSIMLLAVGILTWSGLAPGVVHAQDPGAYPMEARVWLDRGAEPVLQRGERARIYYRVSESAFVSIFHIDTNGNLRMVFPSSRCSLFRNLCQFSHTSQMSSRGCMSILSQ